jgi:uncharacterized protein involved in type VI secretion and phage assembly
MTLRLAKDACGDFYPYLLRLEEGFSKLYRLELTVLTNTCHTRGELAGLLDYAATVSISQTLADARTVRTRWVHGIVTEVKVGGVFSPGKTQGYSYVLVIEPELARLKYTRLTEPYYKHTPAQIIKRMLANFEIAHVIPGEYFKRQYSANLMFDQAGVSDWEFLQTVLELYGISFTHLHARPPKEGLGKAELVFSEGDAYPLPIVEYSDKRSVPLTEHFDFLNSDEPNSIWKMDAWDMAEAIGVDGVELTAAYPDFNYGSDEWKKGAVGKGKRYYNYSRMFHGYVRNTPSGEIDGDIGLILDARLRGMELAKSRWAGSAANMLLMPGRIIELSQYYGLGKQEPVKAMVTGSCLQVRALWPSSIGIPPPEQTEAVSAEAVFMNYGKDVDVRYVHFYRRNY